MPRRWLALACTALLGPTLVAPIRLWHLHGPAACAAAAPHHDHHACAQRTAGAGGEPAHTLDTPRTGVVSASCVACMLAAVVHVAEAAVPRPVFAVASAPRAEAAIVCGPRRITLEPRMRGPPMPLPA